MSLSRYQLWYGRYTPPPARQALRAGPVTALLEEADLRRVRVGDVELAQRIYVAVRDEVWNTIPATYGEWQFAIESDHFTVTFIARHRHKDIDFSWRGRITGTADGRITYAMDGAAESDFRYCKIGFNVHHPRHGSVGRPYHALTPDGRIDGVLPSPIDPQRFEQGRLTAMFAPYRALAIEPRDGLSVTFEFEGDLFELQDHRNWTDGNFKSYGTPLSVPFPMDAHRGQQLHQQVSLAVAGSLPGPVADTGGIEVTFGDPLGRRLPPIGTCMAGHGGALSARETDLLRRLRLDHVRVDLQLDAPNWQERLRRAVAVCAALDAGLELALFAGEHTDAQLDACGALLQSLGVSPVRVLVFEGAGSRSVTSGTTPAPLVRHVRERLRAALPGVPCAGGTNLFFAEINRDPPEAAALDALVYSINPQVHACDDTSLVENLEAQAETVRSARALCPTLPIVISPVTFIGRAGPYAAGPPAPGGLPGNVDVRQASLFGAGWTIGSIKYLAGSDTTSLTYFETTGWLGLIETDAGAPMPDRFPSRPGMVFPLYHVFADLAEWKDGDLLELFTSDALTADGLAIRSGGRLHAIVANLTDQQRTLTIGPFAGDRVLVRHLDDATAPLALFEPDRFRATSTGVALTDHRLRLTIAPFGVVRIDEETASC